MQPQALINDPFGLTMVFVVSPALIYFLSGHPKSKWLFKVIPVLAFLYFVPTTLSTFGVIPTQSDVYKVIKDFTIPPTLFLLTLTVDVKAVLKLGPKALIMFFSGTLGVFLGAPLALLIFKDYLPPEVWKGMSALAGSWIGGTGNFVAVANAVHAPESILGMMVIVDVLIGAFWAGFLLILAGKYESIDKAMGADNSMIEDLKQKIINFQKETGRISTAKDFLFILGLAFFAGWVSVELGKIMPTFGGLMSKGVWMVLFTTSAGIILSFTKLRRLDGVGASSIGAFLIYILIGVIGAGANFKEIVHYPFLLALGAVWMSVHVICMIVMMKILKAPLFFMAVGSQANIGGTASAPIVASAFHPSLASVGVLMALCGTFSGTYVALLLSYILRWMSGGG